jgi:hypothetical protein
MKLKVREIEVTKPDGEVVKFKNMTETCKELGWSYNYIRTRDSRLGFEYKGHKVRRVVRS